MTNLSDTFYLNRAGRYAHPANSNDRLPIVYGDNSGGSSGIWVLPCIDTVNFVYCFSWGAALSAGAGNTVSIYSDDVLVDPADYAFNASNNYEGEGTIATITFTASRENKVITAQGWGKNIGENIIDFINDFLTLESDFPSNLFEATEKALSSEIFSAQGYKAAGVLDQDVVIWDTLINMMGSFLGSVFVDGTGKLVLSIDINLIPNGWSGLIPRGDGFISDAKQRLVNVINQCPCNYSYNYVSGEFKQHTDSLAHVDLISQNVFGVRTPNTPYQLYWCRDLATVQKIQDLIVAKLKKPLYEIEIIDNTLNRIGVDVGDHIVFSADRLYDENGEALNNVFWKVLSIQPEYAKNRIVFRALQTPYFLTGASLLDGSFVLDGSKKLGGQRDLTVY
jgi:hypothetical protein